MSNSIIVSPTVTATYSVIGSNGFCTSQSVSTVSVIPNTPITVTGNTAICGGQSTILTANGLGNFVWNTGATTSSISVSPLNTTTYSVSTPSGLCSGLGTITVNVLPAPTVTVTGNLLVCATQTTMLTATGALNYVWNTGLSSSSITVNPSLTTTYSVVGVVGTCTNMSIVTVTVSSPPNILSLNSTNTDCGLSTGSATISALPLSCTYLWGNGSISNTSTNLPAGIQTVSISNNGCTTQTFVAIASEAGPLFTSISVNNTSCGSPNGSATVIATPSNDTYSWSSGITSTTNSASSLPAGNYTIYALNGACQADTVITVLNSSALQILTSTIVPSDCNLNSGSITINDNGSIPSYSWSPGTFPSSGSIMNLAAGTYSLSMIDGPCTTNSVFIVPLKSGPSGINVIQKNAICQSKNGSINIVNVVNGLPPYLYDFNNSGFATATSFSNLNKGLYVVTVMDGNGCMFTQSYTIGVTKPTVTLNQTVKPTNCESDDGEIRINNIKGGTAPYLFSFNNTSYQPDTVFSPLSAGSYSLNILDSNKCITGFSILVPENGEDYSLYIPNTFTPNTDIVNDTWYVQGTCLGEFNCVIYNRWGEKIIELNDIKEGWNGKYKEKDVPEGVYVFMIQVKTKTGTVKKSGHITVYR
jgi:gliding motility-associated-like protein